jgi:hypothetical protein
MAELVQHQVYNSSELIVGQAVAGGLRFERAANYPSEAGVESLPLGEGTVEYQNINADGASVVLRHELGLVEMCLRNGFFNARSHSATDADAVALVRLACARVARSELETDEINVTFWTLGPNGPVATSRKVACPQWADVESNYAAATRDALERLMAAELDAVQGGKLVLWHGQPGTGKTYALRAWGRACRDFLDVHYIIDPEVFFGEKALYMVSVLLGYGEDGPARSGDGDAAPRPRWRLIVAEDTGELLGKDAKQTTGQSLSRLLNVCDGLIGQGLRSLVLITTNEELGQMHDAVTRPGRCLANIGFEELSGVEAAAWLDSHDCQAGPQSRATVATLYAQLKESAPISTGSPQKVGFAR